MALEFTISDDDLKKIREWDDPIKGHKCKKGIKIDQYADGSYHKYAGAVGGHLSYVFTPNSIGECVEVQCLFCKKKLDLTDVSKW